MYFSLFQFIQALLNFIKVANFEVGESKKEIGCIYKLFSSKSIELIMIDEWKKFKLSSITTVN